MANIKIPTPLRLYTNNQAQVEVTGATVAEALLHLVTQYPDLKPHLYQDDKLRNFVNIFLGDEDIRFLDGVQTEIAADASLRIIPSIAGGNLRQVDHTGLKTGQALTIALLVLAFVLNSPILVALVAICQFAGAMNMPFAPYRLVYQQVVRPLGIARPHVIEDNPEPHRFAMLVGAAFNAGATLFLVVGVPLAGWALVWVVVALANLNFWLNFCAGCWMYYQFNRLGVPGFSAAPIRKS